MQHVGTSITAKMQNRCATCSRSSKKFTAAAVRVTHPALAGQPLHLLSQQRGWRVLFSRVKQGGGSNWPPTNSSFKRGI
jgi:hypothetical protein